MSPPSLILVRHARPQIDAAVPPPQWRLAEEGRRAAAALGHRLALSAPAVFVASREPKAVETAEILAAPLGLKVASDAAFDEQRRDAWPFEPDPAAFADRVRRALADPDTSVEGAETAACAAARFDAGISARSGRVLVVVSHGTVLSAWLAPRLGVDAAELWASVRLPEAFVLDAAGRLLERIG